MVHEYIVICTIRLVWKVWKIDAMYQICKLESQLIVFVRFLRNHSPMKTTQLSSFSETPGISGWRNVEMSNGQGVGSSRCMLSNQRWCLDGLLAFPGLVDGPTNHLKRRNHGEISCSKNQEKRIEPVYLCLFFFLFWCCSFCWPFVHFCWCHVAMSIYLGFCSGIHSHGSPKTR